MAGKSVEEKIREKVKYQYSSIKCEDCDHAKWGSGRYGECYVLSGLVFKIIRSGICMLHSAFGGGNMKRDLSKLK